MGFYNSYPNMNENQTKSIDKDINMIANWKCKGERSWIGFIHFPHWNEEHKNEEREQIKSYSWYNPFSWISL